MERTSLTSHDTIGISHHASRKAAFEECRRKEDAYRAQLNNLRRIINSVRSKSIIAYSAYIPIYDGSSPFCEFAQDIESLRDIIPNDLKPLFLPAVMNRIRGEARSYCNREKIESVDELMKKLKTRFSPTKPYFQCVLDIVHSSMKQNENVQSYHKRLTSLVQDACESLEDSLSNCNNEEQLKQLNLLALQAFIRGINESLKVTLICASTATLDEALESALRMEKSHYNRLKRKLLAKTINEQEREQKPKIQLLHRKSYYTINASKDNYGRHAI